MKYLAALVGILLFILALVALLCVIFPFQASVIF